MKRKDGKLILGILITMICLGIGYAAISSVNLLINGSSSAKAKGDMKVRFVRNISSETVIENPESNAILMSGKLINGDDMELSDLSASIVDDTTANFSVNELVSAGDYAEFTYKVVNESDGIDALLSFDVEDENDEEDYFEIAKNVDKAIITEGEIATVKVRVTLKKSPKVNDVVGNFKVTLTATPEEQEGLSDGSSAGAKEVKSAAAFAKAISDSSTNKIELTKDITVSNNANLAIKNDTTIEFNGNTLTVQPGSLKVESGADLVLEDSVGNGGIQGAKDVVTVGDGSTVTVESGTYESTEYLKRGAVFLIPEGADNAKIVVNGGEINAEYFAVAVFGDSELEINGGTISSTATVKNVDENKKTYHAYSVKLSNGHLTMNGGTIKGIHGGLALTENGTATINGGTIEVNNSYAGANDSFYCIYLEGDASCEVINGTFNNNGTNPLVYSSSTGLANLRGGTWTGTNAKPFNGPSTTNSGKTVIKVYGGAYNRNNKGTITAYDVSGYSAN